MRYVFGADIGGTAIKLGLFTCEGYPVKKYEIPTDKSDGGIHILKQVADAVRDSIASELTEEDTAVGVGVGIPGAVSDGHTVRECINLGWYSPVDVAEEMHRYIQLPVTAINDADAAALGEFWKGAAEGYEDAVVLTIGTGIGAGIIVDGHIAIGAGGYGGEIGHITVNPYDRRVCNCKKTGCLELYCAAPGIVYEAKKAMAAWEGDSMLKGKDDLSAKDVFDAAKAGDALALSRVDEFGKWMGIGLGNVAQTVDPEVFVIGGGVSRAGDILLDAVRKHYPDWVYGSLKERRFVLAALGHDAGIYGAAKLMLDALSESEPGDEADAAAVIKLPIRDEIITKIAEKDEQLDEFLIGHAYTDEDIAQLHMIDEDDAAQCFLPRPADSHKGSYGYVALAGGSFRYSGAIRLAGMAQSAVSSGAGVVMLAAPKSLCYAIRPDILESTLYPLSDTDGELVFVPKEWDELMKRCKVIAIGMGIGNTNETARAVRYLLENYTGRLLIDADGLNALADMEVEPDGHDDASRGDAGECLREDVPACAKLLKRAKCGIVLTPHPAEMARLCGCTVQDVLDDPVEAARAFARKSGAVVLLKGTVTVVSDGDHVYASDRGCAGMATGGSGDVLSGVLAAMMGYWDPQNMPLCKLAACGAWTAGLAGELAQRESCDVAMKASDTARHVRDAVTYLRRKHE